MMPKHRIVSALQTSVVVMIIVTMAIAFVAVPSIAIQQCNGWILLWWIPITGVVSFIVNLYGWLK